MYSIASMGTIAASLFIFGVLFIIVVNFQSIVKSAEGTVAITVFFEEETSQERIDEIGEEIKARDEVKSIEFTSAEESWEHYKNEYLNEELVESFGDDNPLKNSDSITVYLIDTTYQDTIVEYIEGLEGVRKVNYSASIADAFSTINSVVGMVSVAIIIILMAVSMFLISSSVTVGVTARKEEISIMKLLGASNSFISAPFVIEGLIIGLVGSAIPLVILYLVYDKALIYISEKYISAFRVVEFVNISEVFKFLIPITLIIGVGIGFFSSLVTVLRQIRQVEVS